MATTPDIGISRLYNIIADDNIDDKPKFAADQTDLYFAGIKGHLDSNKFSDSTVYSVPDNALGDQTLQSNKFKDGTDYLTYLQNNGSDILNVNGSQVGNMDVAQTNDFAAYDQYFKHSQP